MDLSVEMRGLLLGVFLAVVLLRVYLQMRTMKDRGSKIETKVERDDLYNSLVTVKAVSISLRNQRRDTSEADSLISRAEIAYQARNVGKCRVLVAESRRVLERSRTAPLTENDVIDLPKGGEEEVTTPHQESMSMPENYLQAKFMMGMAKGDIEKHPSGKNVNDAKRIISEAEECFEAEDYDASLILINQAVKALNSEESVVTEAVTQKCPSCGRETKQGDEFCRYCGKRQGGSCPSCGAMMDIGDTFCAKCGRGI